jgi:hypothetical protein
VADSLLGRQVKHHAAPAARFSDKHITATMTQVGRVGLSHYMHTHQLKHSGLSLLSFFSQYSL